jgi:hypothetical protein|tara:strand:+ start:394 stop:558 length:165 start_codon:yes stop_codon:yes gene_type:complete
MEEQLLYWENLLEQRLEDYRVEQERDEDHAMIKAAMEGIREAKEKIEEIKNAEV